MVSSVSRSRLNVSFLGVGALTVDEAKSSAIVFLYGKSDRNQVMI